MGMRAPDAVKRLVDHFDQDRKIFLSDDYKEEPFPKGEPPRGWATAYGRQPAA